MITLLKRILRYLLFTALAAVLFVTACNVWVVYSTNGRVFGGLEAVPQNHVGLVLGASKRMRGGNPNPYFHNRMRAAADLFHSGKVSHLLLSGDNAEMSYNEPIDMQNALIELGVPAEAITLDYAGFRTLDAVVRSNKVFGQQSLTIISQEFHTYRALFLSDHYGIHAVAFCADDADVPWDLMMNVREYLARVKAVLDIYILGKEPKFLGEQIEIPV